MRIKFLAAIAILIPLVTSAQNDTVKYQWPVTPLTSSHGINGTFSEFRNTGNADHFHNAVDIGKPDGEPVYPCMDGIVHSIVSTGSNSYVSVRTLINGKWKRLTYIHISPNPSISVGQQVSKGIDIIGYINTGSGHVHLIEREQVTNINDYAVEINNLRSGGGLTPYIDNYPPVIHSSSLRFRINGSNYTLPANSLAGKVDIEIKIEERNGSAPIHMNNGTYIAGYRIWNSDTSVTVYEPEDGGVKYQFYRKPYDSDVHNVFVEGVATLSNPVYLITNGNGAGYVNETRIVDDNYLDTELLSEGDYLLEIFSEDTRNNFTSKYFPISITRRDVIPPSRPELLAIENYNNRKSVRVVYSHNAEPDIKGYRLYYTGNTLLQNWKLAADEEVLTNSVDEYSFESPQDFKEPAEEEIYFFYLTAVDSAGNESERSDIYARSSFVNGNDYPKVLVVDAFDRYGGSGSWSEPVHSFSAKYFIALTIFDSLTVSSAANEAIAEGRVLLSDYDWVIWYCGDESTQDNTFDAAEQTKAMEYLSGGGNMFVTGSEIGWDLDRTHDNSESSDTLFYRHYLKARFYYDGNSSMNRVNGVPGTPFENLSLSFGESYVEDYPDDIKPIDGSEVLLHYNQTRENSITYRNAAVGYRGVFDGSGTPGGVVYVAYAVESMGSISQIVSLLSASWNYLNSGTNVNQTLSLPVNFTVFNNYPNPFNPSTVIKYFLPMKKNVTIKIYDMLGREADVLFEGFMNAGFHSVVWNASGFSSGIYLARITAGDETDILKLTLIK